MNHGAIGPLITLRTAEGAVSIQIMIESKTKRFALTSMRRPDSKNSVSSAGLSGLSG
jgi:hypothetical protein